MAFDIDASADFAFRRLRHYADAFAMLLSRFHSRQLRQLFAAATLFAAASYYYAAIFFRHADCR